MGLGRMTVSPEKTEVCVSRKCPGARNADSITPSGRAREHQSGREPIQPSPALWCRQTLNRLHEPHQRWEGHVFYWMHQFKCSSHPQIPSHTHPEITPDQLAGHHDPLGGHTKLAVSLPGWIRTVPYAPLSSL